MKTVNCDIDCIVFPKLKDHIKKEGFAVLGKTGKSTCRIVIDADAAELEAEGAKLLAAEIAVKIGIKPMVCKSGVSCSENAMQIRIETIKSGENSDTLHINNEEGYMLNIGTDTINIYGNSPKGAFYAVETLVQLMKMSGELLVVPVSEIKDWPDMKYRGFFVEDRYGPDRMTLEDWKALIDDMASLKLNFLRIGIYGCWGIQYNNRISEYWYLPLKKYPELKTPVLDIYYSPLNGGWKTNKTLPEMFKKDFLKELIAYGKKRNVTVSPLFNSLGHNTLIPRIYPETSAVDSDGNPVGYGFCTSNDKTYEVLFGIYDEIIERYLKPNNIDWFHIGMDEIGKGTGKYPENPHKEADPWCKCGRCSKRTQEELIVGHIIKLAKHLKAKGIKNISVYNDQLLAMGLLGDEFVRQLKHEGLDANIIIDWWKYSEEVFDTVKPELGLRTFVMPMTGYFNWVLSWSHLPNIYNMLKLGHREKVEGVESYCTYDYSADRNDCCLSEYSWNATNTGELDVFRERYACSRFPGQFEKAERAIQLYEKIAGWGTKTTMMFRNLHYYWFSYIKKEKDYPRNFPGEALEMIYGDKEGYISLLSEAYRNSSAAVALFEELEEAAQENKKLAEHYKVECLHYKVLSNEYLKLIEINDKCNSIKLEDKNYSCMTQAVSEIINEIYSLRIDRERLMLVTEKSKAPYLLPAGMRNMSIHRQYLWDLEMHLGNIAESLKRGVYPELPLINFMDTRSIEGEIGKLLR